MVCFYRYIECRSMSSEEQESLQVTHQLVTDVVASMVPEWSVARVRPYSCQHSATLVRVVQELSSKHEIVFESIARKLRLQVNGHRDAELCQRTFAGVVDELFADGRYNWGRVVTVFAYAGWLARAGKTDARGKTSEVVNANGWPKIVVDVAGDYIGRKLSHWVCQQGGWVGTHLCHMMFCHMFNFCRDWSGELCYMKIYSSFCATMTTIKRSVIHHVWKKVPLSFWL